MEWPRRRSLNWPKVWLPELLPFFFFQPHCHCSVCFACNRFGVMLPTNHRCTGFRGKAKNCYTVAKPRVQKSLLHSFTSRKLRKRDFRTLWGTQAKQRRNDKPPRVFFFFFRFLISRCWRSATNQRRRQAVRLELFAFHAWLERHVLAPSHADLRFLPFCRAEANVQLNRRALAALASTEPDSFEACVKLAQQHLQDKWGSMHTPSQTLAL